MIKKDLEFLLKNTNSIFEIKNRNLFITKYFNNLTNYHYDNCKEYKKICDNLNYKVTNSLSIEELPFLPVNVFKYLSLKSVNSENVVRIMKSSGTTGSNLSKIYLDENNARNQIKALSQLFFEVTKNKNRVPMLIIDSKSTLKDRKNFSARSAAILGFSLFAKNITYALKEDMTLDLDSIKLFLKENINTPKIIFGFTYLIWNSLFQKLSLNNKLNFNNSILIHGGGWKKLKEKKISNQIFKEELKMKFNFDNIINYYGMVEQTGSIFFESKCGYFHTSKFSEIFIRDKYFNNLGKNKKGMIQLLSVLPTSYPGHNILTEDTGVILGENDCKCGKKGKYFKVFGRLEKAEVRGCGDAIN